MQDVSTPVTDLLRETEVEIPFPLVPREAKQMLNHKEVFDYENKRRAFAKWLLVKGKDPVDIEGYTDSTAKRTMYRTGFFERYVWETTGEYVPVMTTDLADDYINAVAYSDYSNSHKHAILHSLKRYFKWRHTEHGEDLWEPEHTFSTDNGQKPQDYLTKAERYDIRQAALNYGTIPSYNSIKCDSHRRERLKPYVAEKAGKPADSLGVDDWDDFPSWKFTSMVWASLDAGLRPTEVGRARVGWVDVDNAVLRIPKDESAKNSGNWNVSLRTDTAEALGRWIHERSHYPMYDDTDRLWLTSHGNPYQSKSLRRLLHRLCDRAGIETRNRKMSWYSIRHSVGTYMTREEDLAATKEQLRHKRPETTMKYDAAPPADRRKALDKMG